MITANQARQKAEGLNNEKAKTQMAKIETMISNASNQGRYSITIDGTLFPENEKTLKNNGYKISCFSDSRDGSNFTISW